MPLKAELFNVSNETRKFGNDFGVFVDFRTHTYSSQVLLLWKSEEDARLFVNAVHALRYGKAKGYDVKTHVAGLPSPPAEKPPPRQPPEHKAPTQRKDTTPDVTKSTPPSLPQPGTALAALPPTVSVEKTAPKITITSHNVSGSQRVLTSQSSVSVAGIAESTHGIAEVTVNELQADLNENGNFSADVLLKVGQNSIIVTAVDTRRNKTTTQFIIQRERTTKSLASDKSALPVSEKKEPPRITITSPDVTRSLKLVARESSIVVVGVAQSSIGISKVTVNEMHAELDEKGNFSADVPLKVGQNSVVVAAVDVLKNKTESRFTVQRLGGKVVQARKEETAVEQEIPSANYHALFIAVEDYESKDVGKLDFAVSDARRLRDVLVTHYTFDRKNSILLENPDRRTIYKTLQGLRNKLTEKDNLLIFYAGHGYWLDDMKQGFWLPRDASGINDPSDWVPNSTIRDYVKAIKAKHVLLIADACFSGAMFKVRDAFPIRQVSIEKIYEQPSRKAITSGSMKTVPDRSVFLEFLAKRLRENNDMYLDTQKLFTSIREAVINNSPLHQTPLYGAIAETGDEGGDFIFVKRP
ncbi:MAG: caspase family protein [Deltaproteobacteria bacterium]|nr:caspase family protein [Deltaproteobacteria bacterium]